MYQKGLQEYKTQTINTMTRGELLILLYDEFIKRLKRAELSLSSKDYELFDKSVTRCSDIIKYLVETLDMKYPISNNLYKIYDFILYELSRLKFGRNPNIIEEIRPLIIDLRTAFSQADKNVKIS